MNKIVIQVDKLSKKYRLGVINRRELVDQIESWVARKIGKPDPHASVFEQATDRMPTPLDFWALKDVSFDVCKGDIVGVMGRNGSGKSTLLKLLSRITAPTSGRAYLKGRLASLLEVGTGFNYDLTGKENVYLNGSILGLKKREIDRRYSEIVEFAEIEEFMGTPVKRYSSGMRVRLAFAVAAHLEPDILILDEVLAVGDAKFQEKCLNRIHEIKNSGVTVLFVSHSAESVLQLCNKGILLKEGRIEMLGDARSVTDRYMESLNLYQTDPLLNGGEDSRYGLQVGFLGRMLVQNLPEGSIAMNCLIHSEDGIIKVDLGWISPARMKTMKVSSTWAGAPDISVMIASGKRSYEEIEREHAKLFAMGAKEVWLIKQDGTIVGCLPPGCQFMLKNMPKKISE